VSAPALADQIFASSALDVFRQGLALVCTAAGVFIFATPSLSPLRFRQLLPFALDFWTAAGLLRLSGHPSASAIAIAAIVILIRRVTTMSLKRQVINKLR
jgi:hypothetical protein